MCSAVSGNLTCSDTSLTNNGDNVMSEPSSTSEKAIWLERNLPDFFYAKQKYMITAVVLAIIPHLSSVGIERVYEILKDEEDENTPVNYGGTK